MVTKAVSARFVLLKVPCDCCIRFTSAWGALVGKVMVNCGRALVKAAVMLAEYMTEVK